MQDRSAEKLEVRSSCTPSALGWLVNMERTVTPRTRGILETEGIVPVKFGNDEKQSTIATGERDAAVEMDSFFKFEISNWRKNEHALRL